MRTNTARNYSRNRNQKRKRKRKIEILHSIWHTSYAYSRGILHVLALKLGEIHLNRICIQTLNPYAKHRFNLYIFYILYSKCIKRKIK